MFTPNQYRANCSPLKALLPLLLALLFVAGCARERFSFDHPLPQEEVEVIFTPYDERNGWPQYTQFSVTFQDINTHVLKTFNSTSPSFSCSLSRGYYRVEARATTDEGGRSISYRGLVPGFTVSKEQKETLMLPMSRARDTPAPLVLAEIFPTGTLTPDGKQFDEDKYLLIHNQSDTIVYLDGLCISTSPFLGNLRIKPVPDISHKATLTDAILQVPGSGRDYPLAPHTSALFADNATNHLEGNTLSWNANKANFEFFRAGEHDDIDNPDVPNMAVRYSYIVMNNQASQTFFIWRLPEGMSMEQYLQGYRHYFYWMFVQGDITVKMEENEYKVPNEWIYDAVNLAPYREFQWVTTTSTLDCSYTFCADIGQSNERYRHAVRRKVAKESATGVIYTDNNDSANDFYPQVEASKLTQP